MRARRRTRVIGEALRTVALAGLLVAAAAGVASVILMFALGQGYGPWSLASLDRARRLGHGVPVRNSGWPSARPRACGSTGGQLGRTDEREGRAGLKRVENRAERHRGWRSGRLGARQAM